MNDVLLEAKDLRTYFFTRRGVVKAVDGVSFDVKAGETVALVGESGCGKSVTTLSFLQLVASPPGKTVGGEVHYLGRDLLRLSGDEIRRVRGKEIAMIFQEPMTSLNPAFTIGYQIMESLKTHQRLGAKAARERCLEVLAEVSIADPAMRIDCFPHQLSGGMRQRAMIAMALCCQPRLLIADEPTTAVDVTIQAQLLELISGLSQQRNMAVILITHNLGLVARYVERVNIMYAGQVVERGTIWALYGRPGHPYTIGLLNSVPRLDRPIDEKLVPIRGEPPNMLRLPPGCAFLPRCAYRTARCEEERPALRDAGKEHHVACWNAFPE